MYAEGKIVHHYYPEWCPIEKKKSTLKAPKMVKLKMRVYHFQIMHTKLCSMAPGEQSWFKSWVFPFTFQVFWMKIHSKLNASKIKKY